MTRKGLSVSPVYKALIKAVIVLTDHTCVRKMTHRLIDELYTGSISTLGQSYKVHVHTSIVDFNWWIKNIINTLKFYSKRWLLIYTVHEILLLCWVNIYLQMDYLPFKINILQESYNSKFKKRSILKLDSVIFLLGIWLINIFFD